ncbi:MAG: SDR family NAD(P)-dependent oxidoreductase, partial [Pseudomonadota bacterium]
MCVVTGGSRGIGAAAARLAGERGWDVLVNYRADEAAANAVADHVRRAGAKAEVIAADVGTDAGIKAVFEAADRFGTLTALINNAGVGDQVGSLDTFT